MCLNVTFVKMCCGTPAQMDYRSFKKACIKPCELWSSIDHGKASCPNNVTNQIWIDIVCRLCHANRHGYHPEFGYDEPSEQDVFLNPALTYAEITDLDPKVLQDFDWYVDPVEFKGEHLFREIDWNQTSSRNEFEEPLSPTSQPRSPRTLPPQHPAPTTPETVPHLPEPNPLRLLVKKRSSELLAALKSLKIGSKRSKSPEKSDSEHDRPSSKMPSSWLGA